jgi:CubicO group peptidase (beta-lactamase class C family)
MRYLGAVFGVLVTAATATAQVRTSPAGTRLGFSAERLGRIDRFLEKEVNDQHIAGAVALVLRRGQIAYQRAVGWADKEANHRMTPDAIFRIASQTKAITSVAVMTLVEEGRLGLSDPVSRYLPSFAHTTVATKSDTGRVITPAKRAITIKDLLTHTAGISYGTDSLVAPLYAAQGLGPKAGWGWYTADKDEPICATIDRLAGLPFVAQPGEAWVYGYNTDILGCLVEKVSGQALDRFIEEHITGPLGMRDTHFYLPPNQRGRLTTVYATTSAGTIEPAPEGPKGQGNYIDGPRKSFAGGAGLLSTARDYGRFLEMLRNGGTINGIRILGPKTVALMTSNQVGTLFSAVGVGAGLGFGLGFQTTDQPGANGMSSVGTFGWGGAYATSYAVDPAEGLVLVFMVQMLPDGSDARARFQTLVYQALVSPLETAR